MGKKAICLFLRSRVGRRAVQLGKLLAHLSTSLAVLITYSVHMKDSGNNEADFSNYLEAVAVKKS